jgi:hypothetical protein
MHINVDYYYLSISVHLGVIPPGQKEEEKIMTSSKQSKNEIARSDFTSIYHNCMNSTPDHLSSRFFQ